MPSIFNYKIIIQKVNLEDMAIKSTLFFVFTLMMLLQKVENSCHYSCSQCNQQYYFSCLSCANNQSVSFSITSQKSTSAGSCLDFIDSRSNLLGIALLLLVIVVGILFSNQNIYYFAFIIQTLGLLYFIQVYWYTPLDYLFQSFTYLMIFTYISYPLKDQGNNFAQKSSIKAIFYLKTSSLKENLQIIGPVFILISLLLVTIPLFKMCRRKYAKGQHHFVPDWLLQKITLALNTGFLFLIQQMTLIICMSLLFSKENQQLSFIFLALFIVIFLLFFINICYYPLPFFRNKTSQFICLSLKAIAPIFLLLHIRFSYFFFIFVTILLFIEAIVTNKNPDNGKKNKLLLYKFMLLLDFLVAFVYFLVERLKNQNYTSKIMGILTFIAFLIFIYLFLVEVFFSFKEKFCDQESVAQVILQTQEYGLANITEVQKNVKIYAAQQILSKNAVQNGSFHHIDSTLIQPYLQQTSFPCKKLKLQPKNVTIGSISNKKQIVNKESKIEFSQSSIINNLSQADVCDIFVPQIENFIHDIQDLPENHSKSKNMELK